MSVCFFTLVEAYPNIRIRESPKRKLQTSTSHKHRPKKIINKLLESKIHQNKKVYKSMTK